VLNKGESSCKQTLFCARLIRDQSQAFCDWFAAVESSIMGNQIYTPQYFRMRDKSGSFVVETETVILGNIFVLKKKKYVVSLCG
jgi:hypothetical protein